MTVAIRQTNTEKLYQESGLEYYKIDTCCKGSAHFTKYAKILFHPIFVT